MNDKTTCKYLQVVYNWMLAKIVKLRYVFVYVMLIFKFDNWKSIFKISLPESTPKSPTMKHLFRFLLKQQFLSSLNTKV